MSIAFKILNVIQQQEYHYLPLRHCYRFINVLTWFNIFLVFEKIEKIMNFMLLIFSRKLNFKPY